MMTSEGIEFTGEQLLSLHEDIGSHEQPGESRGGKGSR